MPAPTTPPSPPSSGRVSSTADRPVVLAGRYQLERRLATGGMAEVWLAVDLALDRRVALKWLKPSLASDPVVAERFRREAVAVAGLTVNGQTFPGKTGTAEINIDTSTNQPWFIGFAPAENPQIAVAATIERCTGCFGAQVAGPIATQVMESLLG